MTHSERNLWKQCRDHAGSLETREDARQELLAQYLPLVGQVVRQMGMNFPSATIEASDLRQCGVIGLMSAFERFDPDFGVEFRTYASRRIRGQVLDELRAIDWVPRSLRQKAALLRHANERAAASLIPVMHSLDALQEQKAAGEGAALIDSAPYQEADQHLGVESDEEKRLLDEGLARLEPRYFRILSLYYYENMTLKEIAALFGLTESRICQIHAAAITQLRHFHLLRQENPASMAA